ncbi:uncharacterized protein METZ01_LOCUS309610, partial [marine metagenome]
GPPSQRTSPAAGPCVMRMSSCPETASCDNCAASRATQRR